MSTEEKKSSVSTPDAELRPEGFQRTMSPLVPLLWMLVPLAAVLLYGLLGSG